MTENATRTHDGEGAQEHHPTIHYSVDTEPFTTESKTMTAEDILLKAGMNPAERYLIELQGNNQLSYEGDLTTPIHMHEHMKFITAAIGPKTVS